MTSWTRFRRNIMKCVGKTNSASFRGNPAGEVLCLPVSGRKRSKHDYALTFQFKQRENTTLDLTSLGVPNPVPKKGWEYLEVVHEAEVDANTNMTIRPVGVLVHKPIDEANFNLLGIGA